MIPEPKANSSPLVWVIAVPSPLHRVFEYLPPSDTQKTPQPGTRVKVSFANRDVIGIFLEQKHSELPVATELKRVEALLDNLAALLGPDQLQLLRWLSDYYLIPLGEALQLGLATLERKGRPAWTAAADHIALTHGTETIDKIPSRASKQRAAAEFIGGHTVPIASLTEQGFSAAVISALIKSGMAEKKQAEQPTYSPQSTVSLTKEQREICSTLKAQMTGFKPHLLEGVTGSGKTEIYIECIKEVIAKGHQALVIIPEIGLTPQTKERFEAALGYEVPLIHSGLTEAERARTWAMARSGAARVVLGTRSSVFCSFRALGLIVVDEEHDPSFRQQDHPRYSARDVAVKRAQICNCPIIMGSATPSLESIANSDQGRYQHHTLTQRPHGSALPDISLIDTRGLALSSGLSDEAINQVRCALERNEQALLFLNRRGFAHSLQCEDCGWVADCQHCDSSMAVHRTPPHLSCHYCNIKTSTPTYCHQCNSNRLTSRGIGTEQLEILMNRHFSSTPVFRIDSDNIKNMETLSQALRGIASAESAVLLGTQMLSKGHDFPRVTCVVVVDADSLLYSPDFRAEERLLQLLVQVAGRAGRSSLPGKVLIQTRSPDHPMMQQFVERSYSDQARALLVRRETLRLPPKGAMGLIRSDSTQEKDAIDFLDVLREKLPIHDAVRLIGPMPALMTRRANMYRYQIIVHAHTRRAVHSLLEAARDIGSQQKLGRKVSWFVEIDPTETL